MDAAFVLPSLKPGGPGFRPHAWSPPYGFGIVFTSHALDLKHIEGAVQVTASIKRHWQGASPPTSGRGPRGPSSGGKRISLSPMPIYLLKHSDESIWALMTTVTSFQSATSLAKRLNRHLGDHLDAAALKLVDDVAGLGAGGMPLRIVTRRQYSLRIVTCH